MKYVTQSTKTSRNKKSVIFGIIASFIMASSTALNVNANTYIFDYKWFVMEADTTDVHTVVDEMPEIIGGLPELYKNINYPARAVNAGIEGRVFLQFIVDTEGFPRDAVVLRDIGGGCGEAAIEALQKVRFTPGILNGEAVNVQFSLPVTFRLDD